MKQGLTQDGEKLFRRQAGLLQDVRKGGALDGPVGGHRQIEDFAGKVFLESNMAAALPEDDSTGMLQSRNDSVVVKRRDLGHRTNSRTSTPSLPARSSSTGSK